MLQPPQFHSASYLVAEEFAVFLVELNCQIFRETVVRLPDFAAVLLRPLFAVAAVNSVGSIWRAKN